MTEEPYDRQDALDLFRRVTEAEAFRLFVGAVSKAIAEADVAGQSSPERHPLLFQMEVHLEELLRIFAESPDKSVPFPEVESHARGLSEALRQSVEYWLKLRS